MINLIKHDLFFGIIKYWKRYLIFAAFIIVCNIQCLNMGRRLDIVPAFYDYMFNIYHGFHIFVPSDLEMFHFPLNFCMRGILMSVVIGDYSRSALNEYGHNIIISSGSRMKWELSKIFRSFASVLICHLLTIMLCFLFTFSADGYNIKLWQRISQTDCNVALNNARIFILFFIMPFIFSLWCSWLQEFISHFSSAAAVITVLLYQFISAYYFSPLLFGNYAMIQRYDEFINTGLNPYAGMLYMGISLILIVAAQVYIFSKMNIISPRPD